MAYTQRDARRDWRVPPDVTSSESCCYRCIIITCDKLAALEVVAAWQREKGEVGTDTESKSSR
ncbi:hypothetical protein NPN18_26350, partial [Vibrio parahaemolyticus]|nr:hypothetical protein [Vibrio parahaemolyticus]